MCPSEEWTRNEVRATRERGRGIPRVFVKRTRGLRAKIGGPSRSSCLVSPAGAGEGDERLSKGLEDCEDCVGSGSLEAACRLLKRFYKHPKKGPCLT